MRGRHRPHGQPSATPWSIRQSVRANRNRTPNQTERELRVGREWTDGGTPFTLVAASRSRNAAGNPSSLIRKPNSVPLQVRACRRDAYPLGSHHNLFLESFPTYACEAEGTAPEGFATEGKAVPSRRTQRSTRTASKGSRAKMTAADLPFGSRTEVTACYSTTSSG